MAQIQVRGLKELDAALRLLPLNVQKRVIGNALQAMGRPIVAEAKARVPVDKGDLKRSIMVSATARTHQGGPGRAFVGFRRPFGRISHLVEFGTRFMAARPFMRPALDTKAAEAVRKFGEIAAKGIAREAEKLRGRVGR